MTAETTEHTLLYVGAFCCQCRNRTRDGNECQGLPLLPGLPVALQQGCLLHTGSVDTNDAVRHHALPSEGISGDERKEQTASLRSAIFRTSKGKPMEPLTTKRLFFKSWRTIDAVFSQLEKDGDIYTYSRTDIFRNTFHLERIEQPFERTIRKGQPPVTTVRRGAIVIITAHDQEAFNEMNTFLTIRLGQYEW